MSKIWCKSLLLCPAVLGATLVYVASAMASPRTLSSAAQTPTTAEVPQPQAPETKAPNVNSVAITSGTAKLLAAAQEAPQADAAPVFSTAASTKPEQPTVANIDTPTFQVAVTPATPGASSPAPTSSNALDQLNRYSNEGKANETLAQVTSVSQLSDVQPTDWAFLALQSLVERYGVIAGYPDGTFRGNRALTRYEFAAGLNAALERVNELIAAGTSDLVRREDLATLQRLQEEFAAKLAKKERGRVDALEAQTAELEANQFSTTTKLEGEVIAVVTDDFGDDVDDNTIFVDRVRLDFQTSFFGEDTLHTRLTTGNAQPFDIPGSDVNGDGVIDTDTFEGIQTLSYSPNFSNDVSIDWAAYDFPLFGEARGYIAAFGGIHSDYAATVNPYFFDDDGGNGALSIFAQESPIFRIGGGAGAAVNLAFGGSGILKPSSLTLGYLADNANNPDESFGLFNGDYAALGQLNFNISDRFAIAATYVHGYHNPGDGIFDLGGSLASSGGTTGPLVGTSLANDPSLLLAGGQVPLVTNSYGIEAAFRLSDAISISAFGAYTDVTLIGRGDGEIWTYAAGVAFPDLGKDGNLLGLFVGVEPTLRYLDAAGEQDFDNDYGYHIEGFYKYQLTDNISITPGVIWLTSPGQSDDNDDVVIGTLRTTFTF